MIAFQPGTGEEGLDAALAAAIAFGPSRLVARQAIVTPLTRNSVRPGENLAVHHDAAADARAENHAEHHCGAGRRAVGGLGEREAVGIVGEPDIALQ